MITFQSLLKAIVENAFKLLKVFAPSESEKLFSLSEMIAAHVYGHRSIPLREQIIIGGCLLYVVSPLDIIPDVIPLVGWLDDAALLSWAYKNAKKQVEQYLEWRKENKNTNIWEKKSEGGNN